MHVLELAPNYHKAYNQKVLAAKRQAETSLNTLREADVVYPSTQLHASSGEVANMTTTDKEHDSTFLTMPHMHAGDTSDLSTSFIFPSRSYEVQEFGNIKDIIPEWEDEEVDEVVVLSKKQANLDAIDEDRELPYSASGTSINSFIPLQVLSWPSPVTSSTSCNIGLFKHTSTSSLYAVKTFTKSSISYDTPILEHAMKEQMILRLLTQMNLPYVLKLRWSFQDSESMRLVTDYCPGGDIQTRVSQSGPLNSSLAWLYAAEIAEVLSTLHESGICHRGIRPEHVLIGADGHIVLTGFSRASITACESPRTELRAAAEAKEKAAGAFSAWSAPEVLLGWTHDFAVDCWGLGLLLCFMLTGQHPLLGDSGFNERPSIHPSILENTILHGAACLSSCAYDADAVDLISKCLERNPKMRPDAEEIKDHPYFADIEWTRIREKAYPAPPPGKVKHNELDDDPSLDSMGIQESETLRGVHIAGFNYAYEPNKTPDRVDLVSDGATETDGSEQDHSVSLSSNPDTKTLEDVSSKATAATAVNSTPEGSMLSGAGSAATSSTALYSCTSFGELRDALKARPSEKFPLPLSPDPDFQTNRAHVFSGNGDQILADQTPALASRQDVSLEASEIRPSSILLRRESKTPSVATDLGLGARGLGLRKYASLDFDLDTVVSLEPDFAERNRHVLDVSGRSPSGSRSLITKARRVSFVDAFTSPTDATITPGTTPLDGVASPWKNLSKYYSPNPNMNKLRKRRTESTPVLGTPRVQGKVDLPPGLQQIGLGIGYTCSRPPGVPREKDGAVTTPRRTLSLGTGVARCGALLSNIKRHTSRGSQGGSVAEDREAGRASEESDAMDAVMREMYGSDWNSETGVGYLGGFQTGTKGRTAGKVYSVAAADADAACGSTLRLVQSPIAESEFA